MNNNLKTQVSLPQTSTISSQEKIERPIFSTNPTRNYELIDEQLSKKKEISKVVGKETNVAQNETKFVSPLPVSNFPVISTSMIDNGKTNQTVVKARGRPKKSPVNTSQ